VADEPQHPDWDVIVVGGGPAGLSAAYTAALAGARTLVLERAAHPRYKTCGGGIIGASRLALVDRITLPARDVVDRAEFTLGGRRRIARREAAPLLAMVRREEFDDALKAAAVSAGAVVRERVTVRSISSDQDIAGVRLADGSQLTAATVVGADGSAGVTSRYVGVRFDQVDLGLELELPVDGARARQWRGRVLIDWGPLPGSYGWVFPKGEVLTVGVIAERGNGDATRRYLDDFVARLGLTGIEPLHDSGHLTRCRTPDAPLRRDRVLVAGDAAGLLEPWTREGISFALRSGALAGAAAASGDLDSYADAIEAGLAREMAAGRQLLAIFRRRPWLLHAALASPPGWAMFRRFCRGELDFARVAARRPIRALLAALR
jgi:geranylgeranyl reductase family protein